MTFGQKLQQLRRARGMSQEDLAGQLSVTRQTISKWELDQSTPDLPYLEMVWRVTESCPAKSSCDIPRVRRSCCSFCPKVMGIPPCY